MSGLKAIYQPMADSAAAEYGIPQNIFSAMIEQESGWNPRAVGSAGDIGLGQLTPVIYKSDEFGADPWNPSSNLASAAKFLKSEFSRLGSWRDALAAYNSGWKPNSKGYAYADKILAAAGPVAEEEGMLTKVGKLFEKYGVSLPGVNSGTTAIKDAGEAASGLGGKMKEWIASGGIWIVAVMMILLMIWRIANAK